MNEAETQKLTEKAEVISAEDWQEIVTALARYNETEEYSAARERAADDLQGWLICFPNALVRLAEIGRRWEADSSLEKWFPITADELESRRADSQQLERMSQAIVASLPNTHTVFGSESDHAEALLQLVKRKCEAFDWLEKQEGLATSGLLFRWFADDGGSLLDAIEKHQKGNRD
jgi:hypothetical protein